MSIKTSLELTGMQRASEAVAVTLQKMRDYAQPGMSTKQLDDFGAYVLETFGARSAPLLAYKFPGYTCICVNKQVAHGVPHQDTVLKEGDLVNIDVSAELNG